MAFAPLLREIVEGCRGGLGAALLGYDGMPIEEVVSRVLAVVERRTQAGG